MLSAQLGMSGKKINFSLTTMQDQNCDSEGTLVQNLEVFDLDRNHFVELPMLISRKTLPVSTEDIPTQKDVERWPHLRGLKIPQLDASVGLLIGNDNHTLLEPRDVMSSQDGGPYAVRTVLGWAINGPLGRTKQHGKCISNFISADVKLDHQFRQFCNQEFNDSLVLPDKQMSQDDIKAIEIMNKSVQLKEGHYEIALPLKDDPNLPNNRPLVEHRLQLLKRKLSKDPELYQRYSSFMTELLDKGYAEEVPEQEIEQPLVWYLPHHSVSNPKKPDKTRVVFDCSAKYKDASLNNDLLQGPDMTNTLIGVLLRFRQEPVGFTADIQAMFHQVRVKPEQCDILRYLWWPNGDLDITPTVHRMKVHLFGTVSSPSVCNFALKRTADDNMTDFDIDTINTVKRNFYVDDCLKSTSDDATAIELFYQLTELLKRGGFHLTKWTSNSDNVMNEIPPGERAVGLKLYDINNSHIETALGVQWDICSDTFRFKISVRERPATRRGILSIMSSVFDPLGFIAPAILPVKQMLQDLCREKIGWDDPIPEEYICKWKKWLFELPGLDKFSIDRCIKPKNFGQVVRCEAHYFSDASETAYGAVGYLRQVNQEGRIHCAFMMGKSRLAPLKTMTIPRLELTAATISVRLNKIIQDEVEIPIHKSIYWTDSTAVLKYINNQDRRFNTFVANRIATIHDGSPSDAWRYVDSRLNPSDDASRGMTVQNITRGTRWSMGPGFLWQPENSWPISPVSIDPTAVDDLELKKKSCATKTHTEHSDITMDHILERFSSWYKLKKFICWMLRLKNNLCNKSQQMNMSTDSKLPEIRPITVDEMKVAEQEILRYLQRQDFQEELKALRNKEGVKKSSSLYRLDPIIINGTLRVGGRLLRSTVPQDSKHQLILPKNHHVTKLIIQHYHHMSGHSGREYVLGLLRCKYWLIHANRSVRNVLSNCRGCRRRQGVPGEQKMADLPESRVVPGNPPFSYTGVDYFGPIYVKRGRIEVKRYGCIFTCLSIRAIHVEIAHTLDTNSFINALHRFIARRGKPIEIISDNGTNLVGANKEIRASLLEWNQHQIHESLLQNDIKWIFNPPAGSHHGGVWERCIRTVRKIMMALMKEQITDDEGLLTLMCEIESIVNGRPITTVSSDPRDAEALTPNHLLLLRSNNNFPMGRFDRTDLFTRRRWRQIQYLADQFWKRWTRDYLPLLQTRSKWTIARRNFAIDDIVLIVDVQTPRNSWPMARVLEVYPNKDGLVRRLKLKTKTTTLDRPIDKCILLEAVTDTESS